MSFLHPEFLFWLLFPTLVLFYFWLTQKPLRNRWLSDAVLAKLRAPETTMGLKGRNYLFLISAILIIIAMAQPVMIDSTPIEGKELHIVIAIDRSGEGFEQRRSLALSTLYTLLGEKIEVIAFDNQFYRVAPRSNDGGILGELIKHLPPSLHSINQTLLEEKLQQIDADMKIVLASVPMKSEAHLSVTSQPDIFIVHEKLVELRNRHRIQAHVPLFFYPLGLAMGLILFALSSMSKRQSVSLGVVLFALNLSPLNTHAGVLDFRELASARAAYEAGDYEKAEQLFTSHQMKHDSPEVRYNRANALYMSGKFDRAAYWYKRVYTSDPRLLEKTRYNLAKTELRIVENSRMANKERTLSDSDNQINGGVNTQRPIKTKKITRLFILE